MAGSFTSNESAGMLWSGVAALLVVLVYYRLPSTADKASSRKSRVAKDMRQAYRAIENKEETSRDGAHKSGPTLQISELWVYPIKSLRGCKMPQALITPEGFYLDRRYMLLKDHEETPQRLENMHVSLVPSMCLFTTTINDESIIVSYQAPGSTQPTTLKVPFEPETVMDLDTVDVNMHSSPTEAYDMGSKYNDWFSERFGFKVILAFWGGNPRPVLGNRPGKPAHVGPSPRSPITSILSYIPVFGPLLVQQDDTIAFNDCAPFLVINDASVQEASTRLEGNVEMDLTKFRPNIVVKGLTSAYEEDFWGELTCGSDKSSAQIILTSNCVRCPSLNVDYKTGEFGKGTEGQALKLLQKDRRVDAGNKYSPVFGRYGFAGKGDAGKVVRVGDEVEISRRNEERTKFYWPGLSSSQ